MFGQGDDDKQNVAAAVKLLLAIGSFRSKSVKDFSADRQAVPTFVGMLNELRILSHYAAALFE
eukprot:6690907-Prymnesium_polylepis.1